MMLTEEDVRKQLAAAIKVTGSARQWAMKHKISNSFVSEVLAGHYRPSDAILKPLGLRRVEEVYYEPIKG